MHSLGRQSQGIVLMVEKGSQEEEFLRQREESAEVAVPSTKPRQRGRESILESQAH